jgi:hypothetical protein
MDIDPQHDLPGGTHFIDVTSRFEEAAEGTSPSLILI